MLLFAQNWGPKELLTRGEESHSCVFLLQDNDYGYLFTSALKYCGILCIGLYRQMDPRPSAGSYNRFVIANPPADFGLYPSDKVNFDATQNISFINFIVYRRQDIKAFKASFFQVYCLTPFAYRQGVNGIPETDSTKL